MEAKVSEKWPMGEFVYEPKWDGFRSLSWSTPETRLDSRNQRPLLRYFPQLQPALDQLPVGTVVDGEIVVVIDGVTDFDTPSDSIAGDLTRTLRTAQWTSLNDPRVKDFARS